MKNNNVLITYNAAKAIVSDSRNFDEDETGGILVGTLGGPIAIVDAGTSGKNSVHHSVRFTSDPVADKQCLEDAKRRHGNRIMTAGWWHKHPSGFDRPSSGDCMQVRQLSRQYGDGKPVLMGIVTRQRRVLRPKLNLRIYSLSDAGSLIEHDWKIVKETDKTLQEAINRCEAVLETKKSTFWDDPGFMFYLNPVGRERIIQERNQLKEAGWQIVTGQRKQDKAFTMDLSDGTDNLRFVFPPEFPLNPPAVYIDKVRRLTGLHALTEWNSLTSLIAVVQEVKYVLNSTFAKYGG